MHILVVDDNPVFGRFLLKSLAALGCEADLATNPDDAMNASMEHAPDLVLLDWNLEGTTASELLERLRSKGWPIAVLTGDPVSAGDLGVPVLEKPLHLDTLRALVEGTWDDQ